MKAEQRKELETNTLADKMGQVVQRVKGGGRRRVFIYFVIAAVVIVVIGLSYRYYRQNQETASAEWIYFDDGARAKIAALAKNSRETPAGKAAAFQIAWTLYWDEGVKFLGTDPKGALISLDTAANLYRELAQECKDDPVFEPQALLGIAVCEETRAVQSRARLEKAAAAYDVLATHEKYKETAEGKFAQARLEYLRDSKGKIRAEAGNFYDDLHQFFRVPDLEAPRDFIQPPLKLDVPKK